MQAKFKTYNNLAEYSFVNFPSHPKIHKNIHVNASKMANLNKKYVICTNMVGITVMSNLPPSWILGNNFVCDLDLIQFFICAMHNPRAYLIINNVYYLY